jgi:hypothetical protein
MHGPGLFTETTGTAEKHVNCYVRCYQTLVPENFLLIILESFLQNSQHRCWKIFNHAAEVIK